MLQHLGVFYGDAERNCRLPHRIALQEAKLQHLAIAQWERCENGFRNLSCLTVRFPRIRLVVRLPKRVVVRKLRARPIVSAPVIRQHGACDREDPRYRAVFGPMGVESLRRTEKYLRG
jgi:hypothetical protein